jgi:hypothetical protein
MLTVLTLQVDSLVNAKLVSPETVLSVTTLTSALKTHATAMQVAKTSLEVTAAAA